MIDLAAAHLALRSIAEAVVVAETGSTSLAATKTGFTRATGSFVDDGFVEGMQITADGFPGAIDGTYHIASVADLAITTVEAVPASAAAAGSRSIIAGYPATRLYTNAPEQRIPVTGWSVRDAFQHSTIDAVHLGRGGATDETGLYILTLFGLIHTGTAAMYAMATALGRAFHVDLSVGLADDTTLRIGRNPGPFAGQVRHLESGVPFLVLTIPWRAVRYALV